MDGLGVMGALVAFVALGSPRSRATGVSIVRVKASLPARAGMMRLKSVFGRDLLQFGQLQAPPNVQKTFSRLPSSSEMQEYEDTQDSDEEMEDVAEAAKGIPNWDIERFAPIESDIQENELIHLFPTFAFKTQCKKTGKERWVTQVHGRAVDKVKHKGRRRMHTVAKAFGFYPTTKDEEDLYHYRMNLFTLKAANKRSVAVDLGAGVWWGSTLRNGHFQINAQLASEVLPRHIPDYGSPSSMEFTTCPVSDGRVWSTNLFFIPPQGLSIISDIDDTIKLTQVRKSKQMFRNTFLRNFTAVDGMSDLYTYLSQQGAAFHYVSNSPWQLQPELQDFLNTTGFPAGTFHLKHLRFRLQNPRSFLINRLGLRSRNKTQNNKQIMIAKILGAFPDRKFVLVGDSGEKDPIIYSKIAEAFPAQIERIYIRRVEGDLRQQAHWNKLFSFLDSSKWCVFDDPRLVLDDMRKFLESKTATT